MNVEPLRVLIVDDSRIFRSVLEEALSGRDDVNVVGSVWSGEKAIEFARTSHQRAMGVGLQDSRRRPIVSASAGRISRRNSSNG